MTLEGMTIEGMTIEGRHVVVTGGGSGIGAAAALRFVEAGALVTVMGRTEASLEAQGLPYEICDVTDDAAVGGAFDAARERQGPIEVVLANAGAAQSAPFARTSAGELTAMLEVNVVGVFNAWRAALPDMRAAGRGRLIAVASTAGLKGYPYVAGYCASKHAVVGLTRALAVELARTGITVNAICPGYVETPLLERSIANIVERTGMSEREAADALRSASPQRRFVEASEVADAALWLCSAAARSVNGHALTLSGGDP